MNIYRVESIKMLLPAFLIESALVYMCYWNEVNMFMGTHVPSDGPLSVARIDNVRAVVAICYIAHSV